ncbi:MAG: DUF4160 domain-containing protein [Gammaproteobacteria bacterium]
MPTVLRSGPYRIFFYSSDGDEPAHVHVQRDAATAKYWLAPVRLENNAGYRPSELRRIRSIISANRPQLLEAWDEFFGRAG